MTRRRKQRSAGERQRLPIRHVLGSAWRTGRGNAGRILLVAIAVSGAAAVVETILHEFIDRANLPLAAFADVSVSGVDLLGLVLLSGVLSQVVAEAEHGRPRVGLRQLLPSLPWRRLVLADLLVSALATIGLLLLVIPGLVVFTALAVVGPVIEIEHRPVLAALRRSAHLVRPHFWGVVVLATLPVLAADQIPAAIPDGAGAREIVVFLVLRGVAEAVAEAALGLVLATLTYQLIAMDGASPERAPTCP